MLWLCLSLVTLVAMTILVMGGHSDKHCTCRAATRDCDLVYGGCRHGMGVAYRFALHTAETLCCRCRFLRWL